VVAVVVAESSRRDRSVRQSRGDLRLDDAADDDLYTRTRGSILP
jgi:hypothetical protein